MTDSGTPPQNCSQVPKFQRIRQAPFMAFIEEMEESPSTLSDVETEPLFCSHPPHSQAESHSNLPNLFAIHNHPLAKAPAQVKQQEVNLKSNANDIIVNGDSVSALKATATEENFLNLQRKRKAESTSPSDIQGQLKSPSFTKAKSKSVLFPLNYESNNLYNEKENGSSLLRPSKKVKTNQSDSLVKRLQISPQDEHEVPSTPPPFISEELSNAEPEAENLSSEFSNWKAEMSNTTLANHKLTAELQSQLNFLTSLLPKLQKHLSGNVSMETSQTLVLKAFEKVTNKLEEKFGEYENALNNMDKSTPQFLKIQQQQKQQQQKQEDQIQQNNKNSEPQLEQQIEKEDNEEEDDEEGEEQKIFQKENAPLRSSKHSVSRSKTTQTQTQTQLQNQNQSRSEEEFQELEVRISSLEQELSDSRQFITLLGNKVLEMEAKVFQRK